MLDSLSMVTFYRVHAARISQESTAGQASSGTRRLGAENAQIRPDADASGSLNVLFVPT
jgi:hypothetical protein